MARKPTRAKPDELQSRSMLEMKLLIQFWKHERRRLAFILLFTAVSVAISLAFPYILRYIVDGIQKGLQNAQDFRVRQLLTYVGILLGFGVLRAVVSVSLPFYRGRTNEYFMWRIRNQVFRRVLDMGHSFTNRFPSGDVMERLDHDLNDLSWFACSGVFRPVEAVFTLTFALVILVRMNLLLTLVAVLPVSLAVLSWLKLGPQVAKWYRTWRERISDTNNYLEASFSGIRLVKSYTMEARSAVSFRAVLNERIRAAIRSVRFEALIGVMFGAISELGILLVLAVGGTLVIGKTITLGEFVAFNAYILMLITPMFDIGNFFVAGKRAQAAEERIRALHDFPLDVDISTGVRRLPSESEVFMTNVGFGYPGRGLDQNRLDSGSCPRTTPAVGIAQAEAGETAHREATDPAPADVNRAGAALRDLNMVIAPGAKIGIAGTVGSGKSTIMRLLLRLAEPSVGEITLNGVPLREFEIVSLRSLYGYAPQEANLFSDTIRNNITLGRAVGRFHRRDADDAVRPLRTQPISGECENPETEVRVQEVARIAQLESDLKAMPKGLDELIGERGLRLSGGQKGRVSIARALFDKPQILLLDDVTASLDAETEQQFIADVVKYMQDAALVIVSHRLSILATCDIVFVLDQGRIVECGAHDELLARHGAYWQLYERQLMKEALEA
jgi:ATP-binding cassette subfamily B protein